MISRRDFLKLIVGTAGAVHAQPRGGDGDELRVAYVEHDTRGGWGTDWQYYGGGNMRKFLSILKRQTTIEVDTTPYSVSFRDSDLERLFEFPTLFMTSNHAANMSDGEVINMREYLLRGGFLLGDDCVLEGTYSQDRPPIFSRGFAALMAEVLPDRDLAVIPHEHPVYHCFYDFPDGLPQCHPNGRWEGKGVFDGERLMALLSPNDLCCGWQFNWGQLSQNAFQMGINIFVYALTH